MSEINIQPEDYKGRHFVEIWSSTSYRPVGQGCLERFPGSEQMWVSHSLEILMEHRSKGLSRMYNEGIKSFVKAKGGRAIVATVATSNTNQQERLRHLGWEKLSLTLWMTRV